MDTVKIEFYDAIKIITHQPVKTEIQWQQPITFVGKIITPEEWFLSSDLTDVTITDVQDDDILQYNASTEKWMNVPLSAGASSIATLTDVSLTDLADNDILQYNSSTEKWENVQISVSSTLADLTDVTITAAAKFDHLEHNGTDWVDVQDLTIKAGQKIIFNGV